MKKIVLALAALATVGVVCAADVNVSAVRDSALEKEGVRVSTNVGGLSVAATSVDKAYNRFAVGKDFTITKVGPAFLTATAAGVYQDTYGSGRNGFGVATGVKVDVPVVKNVSLSAGVERFFGQDRVNPSNGYTSFVGVNVKF